MSKSYKCSFCTQTFPLIPDTFRQYVPTFNSSNIYSTRIYNSNGAVISLNGESISLTEEVVDPEAIGLLFFKCPNCNKISIILESVGSQFEKKFIIPVHPSSYAKQFPDYIPDQIREDYEEAYKILNLSPKSSATLSRRCIQGMIRNVFNFSKNTLFQEIQDIEDKIDPDIYSAIDSVRKVGNIGAHMEKDINTIIPIEPNEAELLLKLVELLLNDWYIVPYKRKSQLNNVVKLAEKKQNLKNSD